MRKVLRRAFRPVLVSAAVAVLLGGVGIAVAGQSAQGEGSGTGRNELKRHKGDKNERGPRGRRGRRGPRGPQGLQGTPGPAGAPGVGVQFATTLPTNADPRTIFEQSGVRIEMGCTGGAVELKVRSTAGDHSIIEITSFDNSEVAKPRGISAADIDVNIPVDMLAGGSGLHDYNGLLAVRSLGGEVVTAQWFAMGSIYSSQGDCVAGGTVSP
jgi:hypothetical protein